MSKLDAGEETDTLCTYESKDQNIPRSFTHSSRTATSNDLPFLKKQF